MSSTNPDFQIYRTQEIYQRKSFPTVVQNAFDLITNHQSVAYMMNAPTGYTGTTGPNNLSICLTNSSSMRKIEENYADMLFTSS